MRKLMMLMAMVLVTGYLAKAQQHGFNASTDLLVAQFDLKPDPDDVHSAAALGCILTHADFADVNCYSAVGCYGDSLQNLQNYRDINVLFELMFGPVNGKWTDAHNDREGSVVRIYNKVKPVLLAGGTVWIREGGQSDISWRWVSMLRDDPQISDSVIKNNIVLVQHNTGTNEDGTNPGRIDDLKLWVTYVKIDDGNSGNNNTPDYKNSNTSFLNQALSANNPNTLARTYWQLADNLIQPTWGNTAIQNGGVDFSDTVEDWYILDFGHGPNTGVNDFWDKFVVNTPATPPPPPPPPPSGGVYVDWEFDNTGAGGTDSGQTGTDWNTETPETATPAWIINQLGSDPLSSLAVDTGTGQLGLIGKSSGSGNGVSEVYLPFGADQAVGTIAAGVGLNSGTTYSKAKFNLVNITGGVMTDLVDFNIQRDGSNANNLITAGNQSVSIDGIWEDVINNVQISWSNGTVNVSVTGLSSGDVNLSGGTYLVGGLEPNALWVEVGSDNTSQNTRMVVLDDLLVSFGGSSTTNANTNTTSFAGWEFDSAGAGGTDSGESGTDWGSATPETATPAWTVNQLGSDPQSSFSVDTGAGLLSLIGKSDGSSSGISEVYLPFGGDASTGTIAAGIGLNSGSTYSAAKFNLVHISGGVMTDLVDFNIQRNGSNASNLITTGNQSVSIDGEWEDVINNVQIDWSNGSVDISVTGLSTGDVTLLGGTYLSGGLEPNALWIQVGSSGTSQNYREVVVDYLQVLLP